MSPPDGVAGHALNWDENTRALRALDQRGLPHQRNVLTITRVDELVEAIENLAIRGAPALGLAGAFGVALAMGAGADPPPASAAELRRRADRIVAVRPTAVNLEWGVEQALAVAGAGPAAVLAHAESMTAHDRRTHHRAAHHAASLVRRLCPSRPLRLATHCNTGWLATGSYGTALGAIVDLAAQGLVEEVVVGETRPLLQGARLTTFELAEQGIPHVLAVDSAMAWAMATGTVDCVLVGADRVTRNGDVANKVGTYALAVAAHHHDIPLIVVAPESSIDDRLSNGADITIEQRPAQEVTTLAGRAIAPRDTPTYNPAFDITPASLVTAVVTEHGIQDREPADASRPTEPALTSSTSTGAVT